MVKTASMSLGRLVLPKQHRSRRFGFPALEFGLLDVLVKLRSFPRQPGLPPDIEDVTGFGAGDTASEF